MISFVYHVNLMAPGTVPSHAACHRMDRHQPVHTCMDGRGKLQRWAEGAMYSPHTHYRLGQYTYILWTVELYYIEASYRGRFRVSLFNTHTNTHLRLVNKVKLKCRDTFTS